MTGTRRHGSGRLHALLATALCRLYVTLFLAVIALPSARSWGVAWLVVGLGLAVDLARNLALPDLRLPLAELARRVAADPSTLRPEERLRGHGFGLLWALVWALWGYVLAVLALDALLGTRALEPWLRLLEPAHAAAAAVLRVAREDAAALEAWGYPDRALLVQHVYAVQLGFVLAGLLAAAVAAYGELHRVYHRHVSGEGLPRPGQSGVPWLPISFVIFVIIVHFNLLNTKSSNALIFTHPEKQHRVRSHGT